jgi:hypothetical protein
MLDEDKKRIVIQALWDLNLTPSYKILLNPNNAFLG